MATFSGSVSYSTAGSVLDLADNDFRMIEQNGVLAQWATIDLTDLYPSANFTFGFELTASEDPATTVIPFIISFYDTETRLKFNFNTNASQTAFSVVMENDVDGTLQSYTLYSANHPSLYPAAATKILIRILNGFLWVKVGNTFWLTKHDIQGHPLHLEGGIIQFSLTNSTVLVSHRIQNIYFEPILLIQDQTYFAKGIFPEAYENFTVSDISDASNLRLDPNALNVKIPLGANLFYVGSLTDPEWKNSIAGTTVQRADYPALANAFGVPTSRSTFYVPHPTGTFSDITGVGSNITNLQRINLKGFGDQGKFYVGNSSTGYLSPVNNMTWDSSTGLSLTATLTANRVLGVDYNDLANKPIITGQVNADWNATTDPARILNKPVLSVVATTGSYSDLLNLPTPTTIPTGIITMWYGNTTNIPSGWALCNGLNGTPDLRDRFIIGAGSTYSAGASGGNSSVSLTTANIPAHTHSGTTAADGAHSHTITDTGHSHSGGATLVSPCIATTTVGYTVITTANTNTATTGISINTSSSHTHTFTTSSVGSGSSFSILPPYYALCYIMKL